MDPIPVKKGMIDILQRFFRQDACFPYSDDQDKTKILIADIHGVDRKNVEQYPAVLVARGAMRYAKVGVGDRAFSTWSAAGAPQPSDSYASMVEGNIICHCVSYEGIEAELIATRVAPFLEMTKQEIGKHLKMLIKDVAMGEETPLKNWPTGLVNIPVSFNYLHNVTWKITDLDTIIRGSITTINAV